MYKKSLPFIVSLFLILNGCTINKSSGFHSEEFEAKSFHNFYIAQQPKDQRHINLLIKSELEKKGYKVDTGTINNIPNYTDALVTYVDKWMWDFGTYMYELTIFIKNPKTEYPIASGHSLHGSLTRLTPKEMVKEAVSNMLGGKSE